jgi:hypothetical protein
VYKKCKYCEMYYDTEDQEWLRWNDSESEYCCQDHERLDDYFMNGGTDDDDDE